jgi:hypothetical protein
MLRTYRDRPVLGHHRMSFGVSRFHEPRKLWLDHMLWPPRHHDRPARGHSPIAR